MIQDTIKKLKPSEQDIQADRRTAIVDGVYMKNHPIRKNMLKNNWARYNMLPDVITNSLGYLYKIAQESYYPPKNWKSLFDYTHDGASVYSDYINSQYITINSNKEADGNRVYNNSGTNKEQIKAWGGKKYEGENYAVTDKKGNGYLGKTNDIFRTKLKYNPVEDEVIKNGGKSLSRGRGLTSKDDKSKYCRVWTKNKMYHKTENLIRSNSNKYHDSDIVKFFRTENGRNVLKTDSVLNNNGYVSIVRQSNTNEAFLKSCMFSIENLAWKDVNIEEELSVEQRGPHGGRIMWFPPYDLKFQETVNANWNETTFIGRGEPIYTYTNTTRTGTLSFTLLIDHPSTVNLMTLNEDDDDTILRYFAGCEIPTLNTKKFTISKDKYEEQYTSKETQGVNEDENSEKVAFSIFFPNAYSGYYKNENQIDDDWIDYLLKGRDVNIPSGDTEYIGYEIGSNGISVGKEGIEKNKKTVYYRVDANQTGPTKEGNYEDTKSFQFNSSVESIKNTNDKYNSIETNYNLLSFKDFIALKKENNNDIDVDEKIKKLLTDTQNKPTKIEVRGVANSQGFNKKTRKSLAESRANCVIEFIETIFNGVSVSQLPIKVETISLSEAKNDINHEEAKFKRRADVILYYNKPVSEMENGEGNSSTNNSTTKESDAEIYTTKIAQTSYDKQNEFDFFKNMEENDEFYYSKIKEKFKYFTPAFHSLSPEGFNSRLNFLHQCTRQGHTLESNNEKIAGNLAFGRPPFCILRIGDFIHTKIVVRSMSITYENGNGMQWDLNPEGAGVQPMFAKITMDIAIIGGQSLKTPVDRLNNAVTFNYYANTGVYDSRADVASISEGKVKYDAIYEAQTSANKTN